MKHHEIKPNTLTSFRELLENEYIGGWDLKDPRTKQFRDFTLTIASVEEFRPRKKKRGEKVRKFVICFVEAEKPWLAGPASGEIIKSIYGPPSNWYGKKLTIFFDESVTFGTTRVGGIRPRPSAPKGAAETLESQPVDEERAARLAEVSGREPGDDDAQ